MSAIPRQVEPEWLDALLPGDPRARRSREDLRRVNAVMRNAPIIARHLQRRFHDAAPRSMLDLGSGDGLLMLRIAERLAPRWRGVELLLLDRANVVRQSTLDCFRALSWRPTAVASDVFDWLERDDAGEFDVVVANLFLHHFDTEGLRRLLSLLARRASLLVACEPRRSAAALAASRLLWLLGCNAVSRHDAVVSVRAGFSRRDVSALWPACAGWQTEERSEGWFSHLFLAQRRAADRTACTTP
jgi:SAM-dependent methyltransferase